MTLMKQGREERDGRGQSCPQNVGNMTDAEKPEIPTVFCIFQPRKLLENNVTNIRYLQNVPSKPDALSHRVIRPKVQGKLDQHKLRSARQGQPAINERAGSDHRRRPLTYHVSEIWGVLEPLSLSLLTQPSSAIVRFWPTPSPSEQSSYVNVPKALFLRARERTTLGRAVGESPAVPSQHYGGHSCLSARPPSVSVSRASTNLI